MPPTKKAKSPAEKYKRNDLGLLENIDYEFNEDGSVNWRAMIPSEFLYIRKEWFEKRGQEIPSSPEGLKDNQLAIMLGGIKYLAKTRGFKKVRFPYVKKEGVNYVTSQCQIEWLPNYESGGESQVYEEWANATSDNTNDFCLKFLESIACNRAFVRCVRNFLNIHIVGVDELDNSSGTPKSESSEPEKESVTGPQEVLESAVGELHSSNFEEFKSGLLKQFWREESYRNEDAKDWDSFADIPAKDARQLLKLVKEA